MNDPSSINSPGIRVVVSDHLRETIIHHNRITLYMYQVREEIISFATGMCYWAILEIFKQRRLIEDNLQGSIKKQVEFPEAQEFCGNTIERNTYLIPCNNMVCNKVMLVTLLQFSLLTIGLKMYCICGRYLYGIPRLTTLHLLKAVNSLNKVTLEIFS